MGYFRILAAVPGFFLSSLFVMLFSRVIAPRFGLAPVDYVLAMLITIALWLAVAPLAARSSWWWPRSKISGSNRRSMMGGMMSKMMPMMMNRWFANMDPEERHRMFDRCNYGGDWKNSPWSGDESDRSDAEEA